MKGGPRLWPALNHMATPHSSNAVIGEVLHRRDACLVRRLTLRPGETTPWHRDRCQRVSVILSGTTLEIEYQDGGVPHRVEVAGGQVDWDMPSERAHRAVNVGTTRYEEITIFFLDRPDSVPQPEVT